MVLLVASGLVLLSVTVHYWTLSLLTGVLAKLRMRMWIAVSVLGALLAHIVEIFLFAIGYRFFHAHEQYGKLVGAIEGGLDDYVYFSFVAYSSLGFGDITPTGSIRFLTAVETLTGLVLIAWTASFIFVQMERFWHLK